MINRREFIQTGVTGLVFAGVGCATSPLYKVIYDERFADSIAFGVEAKAMGVATHAIRGDITDLWFKDLDPRWRQDKAAVAGLTTESALFCLERLAWDHQMRVVYRAEHNLPIASPTRLARAMIGVRLPAATEVADDGEFLVSWRIE